MAYYYDDGYAMDTRFLDSASSRDLLISLVSGGWVGVVVFFFERERERERERPAADTECRLTQKGEKKENKISRTDG